MVLIIIALILIVLAFIGVWNTQTILRDLSEIKKELGMKEEKKPSFLDQDIDND